MLSLRNRFGVAAGLVSALVLVFALVAGSAIADSGSDATASAKKKNRKGKQGGLNAKQKRQVIAIAKRFQGTGPQGPQGLPGLPGAQGPKGDKGSQGDDGSDGSDGQSVAVANENPGVNCLNGGKKLTSATGTDYVCNGLNGTDGQTGFTETLPPGKSLTGTWSLNAVEMITTANWVAIPFNIPLANPISGSGNVHWVGTGAAPEECENPEHPGAAGFDNPEADPGHFCVWGELFNLAAPELIDPLAGPGTMTSGSFLLFGNPEEAADNGQGFGSWAVTAP